MYGKEKNGSENKQRNRDYREIIKDNINYDILIQDPKMDKDRLDEIVEIMLKPSAQPERQSVSPGTTTPPNLSNESL